MGLHISDELLRLAGLDEREALIEFACRMFQARKLELWPAAKMARLSRVEMEGELRKRDIAIYLPTVADLHEDLADLKRIGA
jgi:predicted HTH domain antitoxin